MVVNVPNSDASPDARIDPIVIRGRVWVSISGTSLTERDGRLLSHPDCSGVVLFRENYRDLERLNQLCLEIRSVRRPRLLIAVDQEGGAVRRLTAPFTSLPALADLGRYYRLDPESARTMTEQLAWLCANELRAVGIDFSFAPVMDLDYRRNDVIGSRAFGADAETVAQLARAWHQGMRSAGSFAVGKHFPGHGYTRSDSHREACVDEREWSQITTNDLYPFRQLCARGIEAVMSAHIRFPKCDPELVTYSRYWLRDILRRDIRFTGLVFSDDLTMAGARRPSEGDDFNSSSIAERALMAIESGHDQVLVCRNAAAAGIALEAVAKRRGSDAIFQRELSLEHAPIYPWKALQALEAYRHVRERLGEMSARLSSAP